MKKTFRKTLTIFLCTAIAMSFFACKGEPDSTEKKTNTQDTQNTQETTETQGTLVTPPYTITPDEGYEGTITINDAAKTITLEPPLDDGDETKAAYVITGSYEGQIINKVKGTKIVLSNATLTNKEGKPAIYGEKKTEIIVAGETANTITVTGEGADDKWGAVLCEKGIEIGGPGKLTISNEKAHGVKGSKIELKGSGTYIFDGGSDSSAVKCNEFVVKNDKDGNPRTFTATFKDSKNGIKADETITIACGNFKFENISKVALKTDTSKDDATVEHKITLEGGSFTFTECKKKYDTETGGFTKSDSVTWPES